MKLSFFIIFALIGYTIAETAEERKCTAEEIDVMKCFKSEGMKKYSYEYNWTTYFTEVANCYKT